jgi:hypothetical protein
MSLCLLSRRLQNLGLSTVGYCFQLSKAMIALLFDSARFQSTSSTSQPRQQKGLCRQLPPTLHLVGEHSITQGAASLRGLSDPLIAGAKARRPRHLFAALKTHSLSFSGSPDHSVVSTNLLLDDRLCLVCGTHSSASCPVCEQDFCSTHLYVCLDCDSRFCGSCLDDHRADDHWTDSDTNAELSHGRREKLVSVALSIEKDGFVSAPNRTQCSCSNQFAYQSHCSASWSTARNRPLFRISHPDTLTLLFVRVMRAVRSCLAWYAAQALIKLLSQFGSPEVCL